MKNVLSVAGAIALIALIIYFGLYTPISSFNELQAKNRSLIRERDALEEELEKTYTNFYSAIRKHTDWETTKAIYEDSEYFPEEEEYHQRKFKSNITQSSSYSRIQ